MDVAVIEESVTQHAGALATRTAQKAASHVAQAQLELRRLVCGEEPTSPVRIRARNLADTLAELVEPIQRVAEGAR